MDFWARKLAMQNSKIVRKLDENMLLFKIISVLKQTNNINDLIQKAPKIIDNLSKKEISLDASKKILNIFFKNKNDFKKLQVGDLVSDEFLYEKGFNSLEIDYIKKA